MDNTTCRFALVGHVDSGKSTIGGHLLYQCNYISDHDFKNIEKNADLIGMNRWKYAHILDIYEEEQARGKTQDFSIIPFTNKNIKYELIDTPGHKHFIRFLLGGLTSFNPETIVGCLVISLAKGEFESGFDRGQTKEDIILMRAIGIDTLIIAMNKMDLINWDPVVHNHYKEILQNYIDKLGFKTVKWIPVSGFEGINLVDTIQNDWYSGGSLLDNITELSLSINNRKLDIEKCIETNNLGAKIKIINCENIISSGYSCTAYIDGIETNGTIHKIKGKIFARAGDIIDVLIRIKDKVKISIGARIILRNGELTIGFGKIINIR